MGEKGITMSLEQNPFRLLPSVDELLRSPLGQQLIAHFSYAATREAVRTCLAQARTEIRYGGDAPAIEQLLATAEHLLQQEQRRLFVPLINATGVILHTNLGRAPLSLAALDAVTSGSVGYASVEYTLETGERGSRYTSITTLLQKLTGAEAALVTNNNAAAVLLSLSALAQQREVVISRGELVEIGGGFRVPDVMRQSGCHLVEVGTTNRTRLSDYELALTDQTALLLSVHPSNFLVSGFTETTSLAELATLAHRRHLLLMHDLGSGCLLNSENYGLAHEPTPQESIAAGADLVCFSGDKLLGGPQAGILVGNAQVIARLAKHPLLRAVRIDKMTLAALEATLRHYQRGEAESTIPIWRMISARPEKLAARATRWATALRTAHIPACTQVGESTIGGGSLPGETLPTTLLALDAVNMPLSLDEVARRLRTRPLPVVPRIFHNALLLDPRTVFEEQDHEVVTALLDVIGGALR